MVRLIDQLAISIKPTFFELIVVQPQTGMPVRMRLVYCPFCGTYIDERWVVDFQPAMRVVQRMLRAGT